ncbi:MAG: aldo/keto reductase, partial [Pirellulaceae bacterium]
ASSLEHLGTDRIDSYVVHGPTHRTGLTDSDWAAWQAMEAIHESGQVRMLGVSNISLEQLQSLCADATVRPSCVQNRCYADRRWDREIRDFCREKGILYQGFSLLTANRQALSAPQLAQIALKHGCTIAQMVFSFALDVGMIPLTGTTSAEHMQGDLRVFDLQLAPEEISSIENCGLS